MALPMLTRIKAQNLLSFGPEGIDLELPALTVLIGPNGSGKSNLLEMVGLLRSAPQDIVSPIRESGGIRDWIWHGDGENRSPVASVEADLNVGLLAQDLYHKVALVGFGQMSAVWEENIRFSLNSVGNGRHEYMWERRWHTATRTSPSGHEEPNTEERQIELDKSILSEVKDRVQFPELSMIADFYEQISLYRRWEFGPKSVVRQPQSIDVKAAPLFEDFSNFGMFLSKIRQYPRTKTELFEKLGDIYSGVKDFELNIDGRTVQVFFTEGEISIPATRLSDGSLRYLCLLAILLDPEPPKLVCIEEPELGFHPDLVPKLADLLIDASSRCQLIVTTHSDILVDELSDRPESVVVCEKHDGQTSMLRLDRSDLAVWLEKYRLGELWTRGQLGGVRW